MEMEKRIQSDLVAAMKAKDSVRLASVRAIKTAITVAKTAPGAPSELTDGDVQKIIQKLVKQRKDSAEQYIAAGRQELADNEISEMIVMEEYLPKQLSEQEIKDIVMRLMVQSDMPCNMGVVMKYFKENYSGQYDGKIVSTVAKTYLS
jgi:uncharacterized protein YqeY